jgi:uncharacterized membrane protein (UPF0127 family)
MRRIVVIDLPPFTRRCVPSVLMRAEIAGRERFFRAVRKITTKGYVEMTKTLRRRDNGAVVCARCTVADTFWKRFRGLMGRRSLDADEGMVFYDNGSIHMFFMRFPLDVVFCDEELRIVKVARGLKPWRTAGARGARVTIELAAGAAAGLEPGAELVVE